MDTLASNLFEVLFLAVVFLVMLLKELKKKKQKECEEEEASVPPPSSAEDEPSLSPAFHQERVDPMLGELRSSLEELDVHSEIENRTIHGLLSEGEGKPLSVPSRKRRNGRQMMVSYEIFSPPLSERIR